MLQDEPLEGDDYDQAKDYRYWRDRKDRERRC